MCRNKGRMGKYFFFERENKKIPHSLYDLNRALSRDFFSRSFAGRYMFESCGVCCERPRKVNAFQRSLIFTTRLWLPIAPAGAGVLVKKALCFTFSLSWKLGGEPFSALAQNTLLPLKPTYLYRHVFLKVQASRLISASPRPPPSWSKLPTITWLVDINSAVLSTIFR